VSAMRTISNPAILSMVIVLLRDGNLRRRVY